MDRFDRVPVFWAIDPLTGSAAMLPIDKVEESKIELNAPDGSRNFSHDFFAYETNRGGKFLVKTFVVYDRGQ